MIRDELLGNDSVASDTEPLSDSSTSKSEDRLSCSGIAHSLRHIALAFDEKVSRPDRQATNLTVTLTFLLLPALYNRVESLTAYEV
ncbi:hypothetical protein L1887_50710 [Cichorium endivia]|nr:hypothetical protein L1887_50710 [Cichorium endivia]